MKFFNRYTLLHGLIVLVSCTAYCFIIKSQQDSGRENGILWGAVTYLVIVFASAFILSQKDESHGYYGFSYHFITYIIANGIPMLFAATGILDKSLIKSTLGVMAVWGVGLIAHWCIYYFIFRKRTIRQYEKDDVFK